MLYALEFVRYAFDHGLSSRAVDGRMGGRRDGWREGWVGGEGGRRGIVLALL